MIAMRCGYSAKDEGAKQTSCDFANRHSEEEIGNQENYIHPPRDQPKDSVVFLSLSLALIPPPLLSFLRLRRQSYMYLDISSPLSKKKKYICIFADEDEAHPFTPYK